jgi:predicted secreted protein
MTILRKFSLLCLAVLAPLAAPAPAAEPRLPRYNVVELRAEAQREVQNDLLQAVLYVEMSDASPAALASAINKSVNESLRAAKDHPAVKARSGSNQVYPVYSKDNTLQGWRGRAEIRIESRDFEAASAVIGKLQATMQLASLNFSVAPESRNAAEDELLVEAIKAFKARAELAKGALGGRNYKLIRVSVASGYRGPQPRFAMARAASAPEVTAPNLEAGTSQITVTASGAVEVVDK